MAISSKVKYVSDVNVDSNTTVKKPFRVSQENQRRFIRIEISAPIGMRHLKDKIVDIGEDADFYNLSGMILNISAGGLLVDLDTPLTEEDLVLMKFTLQDAVELTNVLGLVKRVDHDEESYVTGIEFLEPNILQDRLSAPEIDMLESKVGSFSHRVQETLSAFIK